jgi:hypothetical protein
LINQPGNKGEGAAIRKSVEIAQRVNIIADLEYNPEEYEAGISYDGRPHAENKKSDGKMV